jgi:hypothetical protein
MVNPGEARDQAARNLRTGLVKWWWAVRQPTCAALQGVDCDGNVTPAPADVTLDVVAWAREALAQGPGDPDRGEAPEIQVEDLEALLGQPVPTVPVAGTGDEGEEGNL